MPNNDLLLQELRSLWNSESEKKRKRETQQVFQIYLQDWKYLVREHLRRLFSEELVIQLTPKINTSLNLLKWVVDELSQIYTKEPDRSLEKPDKEPALKLYEAKGELNLALDRATRVCFALRELVIRPHRTTRGVSLELITPDRVSVLSSEEDLTKIKAIAIQLNETQIAVWTDTHFYSCGNAFEVEKEQPNPYGVIPYMVAHASFPAMKFWHHEESFGLRDLTLSTAIALTDHAHLRHLQSFKQIWIKADETDEGIQEVVLDPSRILRLQGNASVGTIDLTTDLQKHLDSILGEAAAGVALWGLRHEQLKGTLDVSSGVALSLKMINQIKIWDKQRRIWQVWEDQLWKLSNRIFLRDQNPGDLFVEFDELLPNFES